MKLQIAESLKKLNGGDILLTDYSGDIVNLLVNKPKSYRIIYNKHDDVYLICDAMEYIHEEMTEIAIDEGWLPNTKEFMRQRNMDVDEYDSQQSENIIFIDSADIEDAFSNPYGAYATSEYSYEFPIESGSIFTKGNFGSGYFENAFPDLYSKLHRYAVDKNHAFVYDKPEW